MVEGPAELGEKAFTVVDHSVLGVMPELDVSLGLREHIKPSKSYTQILPHRSSLTLNSPRIPHRRRERGCLSASGDRSHWQGPGKVRWRTRLGARAGLPARWQQQQTRFERLCQPPVSAHQH